MSGSWRLRVTAPLRPAIAAGLLLLLVAGGVGEAAVLDPRTVNAATLQSGLVVVSCTDDDATVVSILPRMKQQSAARVLQIIPAERAARLSKKMMTIAGDKM